MDGLMDLLILKKLKVKRLYKLSCKIKDLCWQSGEMDFVRINTFIDEKLELTKDIDYINSQLDDICDDLRSVPGYVRLSREIKEIVIKLEITDKQNIKALSKAIYESKENILLFNGLNKDTDNYEDIKNVAEY